MHWEMISTYKSGMVETKQFVRFVDVLEELDHIDEDEVINIVIRDINAR